MSIKTARKNYLCSHCKKVIEKGVKYWPVEGSMPVGNKMKIFTSSRICLDCLQFLSGK